ncbi:hypothetical protein B0T22DRAFT_110219 [Podospora appendiculata]|uniref:HMG box domain-containing protein n=1 Tax=Podospora appendiculata TaxID=314037 RepID=A0AAE0XL74_9PEZI|nr:hypothetical protein B0T22DRAFT_110219 [Podospora appendiculata]
MADQVSPQISAAFAALFSTISDHESDARKAMISLLDPATIQKPEGGVSLDSSTIEKIIATVDPDTALKMDTAIESTYFVEQTALWTVKRSFDTRRTAVANFNNMSAPRGRGQHAYVLEADANYCYDLDPDVREFLVFEISKITGYETTSAVDAADSTVVVLGPKAILGPNIIEADNERIWDPKGVHGRSSKIPRPPEAFILYRKDKHPEIKSNFPGIHNNEISVMIGSMWCQESVEVRAKYHDKSQMIKAALMATHPDYRYKPRKSSEIKKRRGAARILVIDETAFPFRVHDPLRRGPDLDIDDEKMLRRRFPGIRQVRVKVNAETEITQRIACNKKHHVTILRGWTPRLVESWVLRDVENDFGLFSHGATVSGSNNQGRTATLFQDAWNGVEVSHGSQVSTELPIREPEVVAMDMHLVEDTDIDSIVENWDQHLASAN